MYSAERLPGIRQTIAFWLVGFTYNVRLRWTEIHKRIASKYIPVYG